MRRRTALAGVTLAAWILGSSVSHGQPTTRVEAMENDFILAQMSEDDAAPYLCGQNPEQPEGAEYYGVLFRFKTRGGGILGLLWSRENNRWRVISYREFEQ